MFLQLFPENRKKEAQTKKDSRLRSGRKRVSFCLCSMSFELNYLKNHGTQILHQLLLHLFSKLLRSFVTLECCVISIFSSAFSAQLKVAQGQERDTINEISYDYVSDGEDSINVKWVVRKPSLRSQEGDRIS